MLGVRNLHEDASEKSRSKQPSQPDAASSNNRDLVQFMPETDLTQSPSVENRKQEILDEPQIQTQDKQNQNVQPSKGKEAASARGSYDFLKSNSKFNIEDLRQGRSVSINERRNSSAVVQEYEESGTNILVVGKEVSENSSIRQQKRVYQQYDEQITSKPQTSSEKNDPEKQKQQQIAANSSVDQPLENGANLTPTVMNSPQFNQSNLITNSAVNSQLLTNLSPQRFLSTQNKQQSDQNRMRVQYTQPITPNDISSHQISKQQQQAMQNRQLVYTAQTNQLQRGAPSSISSSAVNLSRGVHKGVKQHRRLFSAQVASAQKTGKNLHRKKISDILQSSEKRTAAASASGKSLMPHDKRMNKLAHQKLSQLLVFDENSQVFKVQQPGKMSRPGTQCSVASIVQNIEQKGGFGSKQTLSRFSRHTNKRAENLEKQQKAQQKLLEDQNERNSYISTGTNLPKQMSRSSVSKLLHQRNSSSLQKVLLGSNVQSQQNFKFIKDEQQSFYSNQFRSGSVSKQNQVNDYDFQKTHVLLHEARAKHEMYLNSLRNGSTQNPVFSNQRVLQSAKQLGGIQDQNSATNSGTHVDSSKELNYVSDRAIFNKQQQSLATHDSRQSITEQNTGTNHVQQMSPKTNPSKPLSDKDIDRTERVSNKVEGRQDELQFNSPERASHDNSQLEQSMIQKQLALYKSQDSALSAQDRQLLSAKRRAKDQEAIEALRVDQEIRRSASPHRKKDEGQTLLTSAHKLSLQRMSRQYLQGGNQIQGIDLKLLDDDLNYRPSTEFSVTLNFKKEFVRHKQIICSIKEFNNFDIQNKWDIGYCKTFCHNGKNGKYGQGSKGVEKNARDAAFSIGAINQRYKLEESNNPQHQTEGEKIVNLVNKHSYFENYELEDEIKENVSKIVYQLGQTQAGGTMKFLSKESTLFNTHTRELVEGYLRNTNEAGIGLCDFEDQMVLRFKNDSEIGLYFDAVDQLCQVIILKGRRVLLEKEHYGEIMEKFIDLNKNFMLFLCKDEDYGDIITQKEQNDTPKQEQSDGQQYKMMSQSEFTQYLREQQQRFAKRDHDHRSFIRAFLFDYIFKTFIQILDECISQRERLLSEKQEEWAYYTDKKCNQLDSEVTSMMKQIAKLRAEHKNEQQAYEARIEKLKEEQRELQIIIQEYKTDLAHLANFESRTDEIGALRNHLRDTTEMIVSADEEMGKQREAIVPVLNMINVIAHEPGFKDASTQSDCHIGCHNAHLNAGLNASKLEDLAETSISRLQGIMSQIRVAAYNEEKEEQEAESLRIQKQKTSASKSSAKGKQRRKTVKKSTTINLEGTQSKLLEDHDKILLTIDELREELDGYMDSFHKQKHKSLNDFICSKVMQDCPEQNVLEAAQRIDSYVKSITHENHTDHPYVQLISKILGFNGFKAMDSGELFHFIELRDQLQRDAGQAAGDEVMLFKVVDFVCRNFRQNQPLMISILKDLYLYAQRPLQQKMGLSSISEIVKPDSFKFPEEMNESSIKNFFAKQKKKEPLYFWRLSFIILNFLSQLKQSRKDIESLFKHETKEGYFHPRKAEFMNIIKAEAFMASEDLDLLWTFIDPDDKANYSEKFKADVSNFVAFCKLQTTQMAIKARMSQIVVLNCVYDKMHQYLDKELPQAIEQSVRKTVGVELTQPGPMSNELTSPKSPSATAAAENQGEQPKTRRRAAHKKSKKQARAPGELCYHTELKQVEKCYNALMENANIREKYAQPQTVKQPGLELKKQGTSISGGGSPGTRAAGSPGLRRTNLSNSPSLLPAPSGINVINLESVFTSNLLIRIGHQLDCLKPLSQQLQAQPNQPFFGSSFLSTYMGSSDEYKINDFIKGEFQIDLDEKATSSKKKGSKSSKTKQSTTIIDSQQIV